MTTQCPSRTVQRSHLTSRVARRPGGPLSRPTSRREFIAIAGGTAAAVSVFGLGACGGGDSGGAGSGDVLLSISPGLKEIDTTQIATFNKQNPDGKVTVRI